MFLSQAGFGLRSCHTAACNRVKIWGYIQPEENGYCVERLLGEGSTHVMQENVEDITTVIRIGGYLSVAAVFGPCNH